MPQKIRVFNEKGEMSESTLDEAGKRFGIKLLPDPTYGEHDLLPYEIYYTYEPFNWGLRVNRDIPINTLIARYIGIKCAHDINDDYQIALIPPTQEEIINEKIEQKIAEGKFSEILAARNHMLANPDGFDYKMIMKLFGMTKITISSKTIGTAARFINHAPTMSNISGAACANLKVNPENDGVALWSTRSLKKDEALLLDYGNEYWQARHKRASPVDRLGFALSRGIAFYTQTHTDAVNLFKQKDFTGAAAKFKIALSFYQTRAPKDHQGAAYNYARALVEAFPKDVARITEAVEFFQKVCNLQTQGGDQNEKYPARLIEAKKLLAQLQSSDTERHPASQFFLPANAVINLKDTDSKIIHPAYMAAPTQTLRN